MRKRGLIHGIVMSHQLQNIKKYYNYKNFVLIPSFFGLFLICFLIIYNDTNLFRVLSSIEYYSRASRFIDYNILPFNYAIKFGIEKV